MQVHAQAAMPLAGSLASQVQPEEPVEEEGGLAGLAAADAESTMLQQALNPASVRASCMLQLSLFNLNHAVLQLRSRLVQETQGRLWAQTGKAACWTPTGTGGHRQHALGH